MGEKWDPDGERGKNNQRPKENNTVQKHRQTKWSEQV